MSIQPNPFAATYNNNKPGMPGPYNQQQIPNWGNGMMPNQGFGATQPNGFGGGMQMQQGVGLNGQQQQIQEKDKQIQQLRSIYPKLQHQQIRNNGPPFDFVELSLQIETPNISLQVPMALILYQQFPSVLPKVFIKSKLKHNLFEVKDQTIELDVNNVMQWNAQKVTLLDLLNTLKSIFEKDPPKQEYTFETIKTLSLSKIIEEVNKLLSGVSEKNFQDLIGVDCLSQRSSVDDLRQLQGISFQELICSSEHYKKIGQNLVDVINFNERVSNELLQKREDLEQHKQSLLLVSETIEQLTKEYNNRIGKCKEFKDAFSRQNIEGFINKEIKNFDDESINIESIAQSQQGCMQDVLQTYFDTRKNFHNLNIIKSKLPELKIQ